MSEIDDIKRLAGITEQDELGDYGFKPVDEQSFFKFIGGFKSEGVPEQSGKMLFYIMDRRDQGPVAVYSPGQQGGPFFIKGTW